MEGGIGYPLSLLLSLSLSHSLSLSLSLSLSPCEKVGETCPLPAERVVHQPTGHSIGVIGRMMYSHSLLTGR